MAGIRRSRPQPIAQHYHVDIRRRYEVIRRKECLRQALSGPNGHRLFAVGPQVNEVKAQSSVNGNSGVSLLNTILLQSHDSIFVKFPCYLYQIPARID